MEKETRNSSSAELKAKVVEKMLKEEKTIGQHACWKLNRSGWCFQQASSSIPNLSKRVRGTRCVYPYGVQRSRVRQYFY